MSWLRIDDGFAEHPKVMDLSDRAFRLHVAAMCFCARNLTDGELAEPSVRMVCALAAATRKHVAELVDAGLWVKRDGGGFEVKDFLDYNPPAERVKEDRAKARDRMRRVRSPERSPERSATPDQTRPEPLQPSVDQKQTVKPPEQTRAREAVAALVDSSLGSGERATQLVQPPRVGVDVLIDLLPPREVARNTRSVLERKFAQLPPHFIDLAREELLAADDVRSPVKYLNGIADRMITEFGRRLTPSRDYQTWVNDHFDDPDADSVIASWPIDAIERQSLHERAETLRTESETTRKVA